MGKQLRVVGYREFFALLPAIMVVPFPRDGHFLILVINFEKCLNKVRVSSRFVAIAPINTIIN